MSAPQSSEAKRPTATTLYQSTDADSLPQLFLYVRYGQCDEMKQSCADDEYKCPFEE
jgi:hypothetical protein